MKKFSLNKQGIIFLVLCLTSHLISIQANSDINFPEETLAKFRKNKLKERIQEAYMGLRNTQDKNQEIPLKHIKYDVNIKNSVSVIESTQVYVNNFNQNIETEYFFAISPESAFISLEAEINGKVIVGTIKEKEEAKQEYEQALKEGRRTAYAEVVDEVHDIMKIKLGNLKPGEQAMIKFSYIEPLDVVLNKFWSFSLTNTFSKRSGPQNTKNSETISENMECAMNNPQISENNKQAYTMSINISIDSPSPITFAKSPTHDINVNYLTNDKKRAIIVFKNEEEIANKNLVILFRNEEINKPSVQTSKLAGEKGNTESLAALVTFFPDFRQDMSNESAYQKFYQKFRDQILNNSENNDTFGEDFDSYLNQDNVRGEYIFVVDRSGSMGGGENSPMELTKNALIQALNILPQDSYFNIVSFGSNHTYMYPKSQKSSSTNIQKAISEINSFGSNYGGTEIYQPLYDVLNQSQIEKYPKNIFLLTDGQTWNEERIFRMVKQQTDRKNTRVYTLGMGQGVSQNLVRQTAQEGKGKFELIPDSNKNLLKQKLMYLIKDSITPFLENFSISFENEDLIDAMVPKPSSIKSIRKNEPFRTVVFLNDSYQFMGQNYTKITLKCYDSQSDKYLELPIDIPFYFEENIKYIEDDSITVSTNSDGVFQKLGIHKLIKEALNNAAMNEDDIYHNIYFKPQYKPTTLKAIIDLSVKYQVLSDLTAFILVDKEQIINPFKPQKSTKINIPTIEGSQNLKREVEEDDYENESLEIQKESFKRGGNMHQKQGTSFSVDESQQLQPMMQRQKYKRVQAQQLDSENFGNNNIDIQQPQQHSESNNNIENVEIMTDEGFFKGFWSSGNVLQFPVLIFCLIFMIVNLLT